MPRVSHVLVGFLCYILCIGGAFSNDYLVDIDLKDALHGMKLDVKDMGDFENMVKGSIEGDIYANAYARAELNVVAPATDSLDAVYDYVADRCDREIAFEDVTTVFAQTPVGKELFSYLEARDVVEDVEESENYGASCERVVECFFDDIFSEDDKKNLGYTHRTRDMCATIVEDAYDMMHIWVSRLQTIQDINYGDELLANAKEDDGPFDILHDIEKIGTLLFTHNDPASEIQFFRVEEPQNYVDNDPDNTTTYTVEHPNEDEDDPLRRLEPSIGLDPQFPRSIYYDEQNPSPDSVYVPPEIPPEDVSFYTDPAPIGGSPADVQAVANSIGPVAESPAASTLQNAFCEPLPPEPEEEKDLLELGIIQQEQTTTYNDKLDLDVRVALALGAMVSPDIEEQYGIDPVGLLQTRGVPPGDITNVFNTDNLKGASLEQIEAGMKGCFEQFTDIADKDTYKKAVWKNITQPTAFTSCVMQQLCFEITDESGRGLYRIQGCTIPSRRGYSVSDNQPVMSIEEAMDEFLNVCIGLEESGQLLEHNKTKDARDHKLMRVKFGEKFSFSLSIGFKPLKDKKDPAHEKRMEINNNRYLMDNFLHIHDNLGQLEQRNKYVQFYDVDQKNNNNTINPLDTQEQNSFLETIASAPGEEIINKEKNSQVTIHAETLDILDTFVDRNTAYRVGINDITHSIMQNWQAELKEAKQAK